MEAPFLPPVSAGLFWCLVFPEATEVGHRCERIADDRSGINATADADAASSGE